MVERQVWRVVGWLMLTTALLVGGVSSWEWLAQQSHSEQRVYWQPIKTVELDSGSAEVRLVAGAADRVTVGQKLKWALRRPSVEVQLAGQTLKVAVQCHSPLGVTGCGVTLDIQVPAATAIQARSSSGAVQIHGVSGEIRAQSLSGQFKLDGVSGPVWVKSTSGQIVGRGLASQKVQAAVTSGRIDLAFARPPEAVTVLATSGETVVAVPTDQTRYNVTGHVTSGNWGVDPGVMDSTSHRTIDATVTSGDVSVTPALPGSATDEIPDTSTNPSTTAPTAPTAPTAKSPSTGAPASGVPHLATPPGGGQ
ncbi:DUF4097 family beta strand repeat-containing protein [Kitasatospora sp. McL0602]|uniref:DUF4097 family beta strand repeat-containing protein n=1 Tax=Kitasatospora sp. McL0602 TaxID=3439530 RepID=UPI003F88CA5B